MNDFLKTDSNNILLSEFYENHINKKYNYDAAYQREIVWSEEKQKFLIDTILKNFPMPPIFLRMSIDEQTGITKYDVIDGKQRLTSIIKFIEGDINLPDDFDSGNFGNDDLNGLSFKELESFPDYKSRFWRYKISIIYIDNKNEEILNEVFDRLNRNGEQLTFQELRHAKYHDTDFYKLIEELSNNNFWKNLLKSLEVNRMEDREFISEILFLLLEKKVISYTKEELDKLYEKWIKHNIDYSEIYEYFLAITTYMQSLNLDYKTYKISGVSHLYGIFGLCINCYESNIPEDNVSELLTEFYIKLRSKKDDLNVQDYRNSMSSSTKQRGPRVKRIQALSNTIKINMPDLKNIIK